MGNDDEYCDDNEDNDGEDDDDDTGDDDGGDCDDPSTIMMNIVMIMLIMMIMKVMMVIMVMRSVYHDGSGAQTKNGSPTGSSSHPLFSEEEEDKDCLRL